MDDTPEADNIFVILPNGEYSGIEDCVVAIPGTNKQIPIEDILNCYFDEYEGAEEELSKRNRRILVRNGEIEESETDSDTSDDESENEMEMST